MLTLKRASKHRPSGPWPDDDYDVFEGEQHIGRILWTYAANGDTPWFWTITARVLARKSYLEVPLDRMIPA